MIRTIVFSILLLATLTSQAYASESSGTIDATSKNAKVCHSVGCVTPTPGVINFKPTGTTPVTIDDTTGIDGLAWGNELGWITMDPTGSEGLTINTTTGVISGKAWSQVSGWVNFAPTGQSVTINASGEFVGWAWAGGPLGGWIKFDCTDAAACVKTDWRPIGARMSGNGPITGGGSGGGGGGGGGSPSDLCWNLSGIQYVVPVGYTQNGNTCQVTSDLLASNQTIDACLNLAGQQTVVPSGYVRDTGGLCVPMPTDTRDYDGDGIPDILEQGDSDQDTVPDYIENNKRDTDGDGFPNHLDPDDDGDGYPTSTERTEFTDPEHTDFDQDGILSYLDAIFNGRRNVEIPQEPATQPREPGTSQIPQTSQPQKLPPATEEIPLSDAPFSDPYTMPPLEEVPSALVDADADGIPDAQDPVVAPYTNLRGGDSDGDSIMDLDECPTGYPCLDDNANGLANYLDPSNGINSSADGGLNGGDGGNTEADGIVHFAFIPRAVHVPVDVPAFTEAFRAVVGNKITDALLVDQTNGETSKVDAVSLTVLVGTTGTALFGLLFATLRIVGFVALLL